jgi:hypothetical protein
MRDRCRDGLENEIERRRSQNLAKEYGGNDFP